VADKRAVAFHEAAHAVVGLLEGVGVSGEVSIVPDAESRGRTAHRSMPDEFRPDIDPPEVVRQEFEPRIVTALAGVIAERRAMGRSHRARGGHFDLKNATDMAMACTGSAREAELFLRWQEERARHTVEKNWPYIQRVAAELVERSTMTAAEVELAIDAVDEAEKRRGAEMVAGALAESRRRSDR